MIAGAIVIGGIISKACDDVAVAQVRAIEMLKKKRLEKTLKMVDDEDENIDSEEEDIKVPQLMDLVKRTVIYWFFIFFCIGAYVELLLTDIPTSDPLSFNCSDIDSPSASPAYEESVEKDKHTVAEIFSFIVTTLTTIG